MPSTVAIATFDHVTMTAPPSMAETVANGCSFPSDWREARDSLRLWREEGGRESSKVVALGVELVTRYGNKLGEEGERDNFLKLICPTLTLKSQTGGE